MSIFALPTADAVYILVLSFILGSVFGSFCNAWAWRIVNHEDISHGRSHCTSCGHTLGVRDLVPLVSWLALKGKCRYCGAPISKRYFLAELVLATYFFSILAVWGISFDTLRFWILGSILLVMSLEDLDIMEIEDFLQVLAAVSALIRLIKPGSWRDMLWGLVVPAVMLLLVLVMEMIMKKEAMGGGDIKLMAALALHFGPFQTMFLLIVACVVGLAGASAAKKGFGKAFPFGPAIAIAAWITALVGTPAVNAYLSLL